GKFSLSQSSRALASKMPQPRSSDSRMMLEFDILYRTCAISRAIESKAPPITRRVTASMAGRSSLVGSIANSLAQRDQEVSERVDPCRQAGRQRGGGIHLLDDGWPGDDIAGLKARSRVTPRRHRRGHPIDLKDDLAAAQCLLWCRSAGGDAFGMHPPDAPDARNAQIDELNCLVGKGLAIPAA